MTYIPSGNPASGSEGLSALMRAEFTAIGTAFTLLPAISTTGAFSTIFAQQGNYTFTLPPAAGALATTANVATETTRAQAAETTLTTAVSVETMRAQAAESANATAISTETTARTAAGNAEATARTSGDAANATAISTETTRAEAAEALLAPLASPALTGVPTAPTAAPGTSTTQVATTAFVGALAPKASPAFTGTPTAPTAAPGTNTTQLATTAFATAAVATETTRAEAAEAVLSAAVGIGTWFNYTASRALNTIYTNTADVAIYISISIHAPNPIYLVVNSADAAYGVNDVNFSVPVPPGQTYQIISVGATLNIWCETIP